MSATGRVAFDFACSCGDAMKGEVGGQVDLDRLKRFWESEHPTPDHQPVTAQEAYRIRRAQGREFF